MINYLSKFNSLSIKLITCQNKLIADQKMIDDYSRSLQLQLLTSFDEDHVFLIKLYRAKSPSIWSQYMFSIAIIATDFLGRLTGKYSFVT